MFHLLIHRLIHNCYHTVSSKENVYSLFSGGNSHVRHVNVKPKQDDFRRSLRSRAKQMWDIGYVWVASASFYGSVQLDVFFILWVIWRYRTYWCNAEQSTRVLLYYIFSFVMVPVRLLYVLLYIFYLIVVLYRWRWVICSGT